MSLEELMWVTESSAGCCRQPSNTQRYWAQSRHIHRASTAWIPVQYSLLPSILQWTLAAVALAFYYSGSQKGRKWN